MPQLLCANISECQKPASSTCAGCKLVQYCGKPCQTAHWKAGHRSICKSPVLKASWQPQWMVQRRDPAFMRGEDEGIMSRWGSGTRFLLGNMPAVDHFCLGENEGADYCGDFDALFAACGDLRNVVLSVNASDIKGKLHIVLNDHEPYVMIRAMLLLIIFASLPPAEAAEAAIHLWYSPSLPATTMSQLRELFAAKLDKMRQHLSGDKDGLLSTSIKLSETCGMRCPLPRHCWRELFQVLDSRIGSDVATNKRHYITMAPHRLDYRERHVLFIAPQYRLSKLQYYEDGLVLPFGADRSSFTETNPTLFNPNNHSWHIADSHDPVNGWDVPLFLSSSPGPAHDLYGALHHYLHSQFLLFSQRLQSNASNINFTLVCRDARQLQSLLRSLPKKVPQHFDRIDVSNLTDLGYIGVGEILAELGHPLLKYTTRAVLSGLFMNYTADLGALKGRDPDFDPDMMAALRPAGRYAQLHYGRLIQSMPKTSPMMMLTVALCNSLKNFDKIWKEYAESIGLDQVQAMHGVRAKSVRRPHAFKKTGRDAEDLESLLLLELGGVNGHETYVEWVRL
ncbi:hypothetical protein EDC01DRAFT_712524 [Geopyxis carbonaria]|nr:hypothetical protein EDC01DRAFT_712524 [Geopyxis carbonaria]